MTSIGAFVVFSNVFEMFDSFEPASVPVIPVTLGADHEYVVPDGTLSVPSTGVTVNISPEQITSVVFAMFGTGSTVTVTVNVLPVHVPETGVTV